MGVRGEIYSNKVILPNRTYFFNVKENRLGDLYLNIVESKNKETGGFDRQSVILFAEDMQEFLKGLDESLKILEKAVREKRRSGKDFEGSPEEKPVKREWEGRSDREGSARDRGYRGDDPHGKRDTRGGFRGDDYRGRRDTGRSGGYRGNDSRGNRDGYRSPGRDRRDRPAKDTGDYRSRRHERSAKDSGGYRGSRNDGNHRDRPDSGRRVVVKKRRDEY